ncbi:MAG: helix-turn-helix domain-containing protein [Chloroflexaceae bacterium]|nr:helix-turn-helix domain-containing protein [Chloroflexaceae bacterium]
MPTILAVDNDLVFLTKLGGQLEEAGYNVVKAGDVGHAEQCFAEDQPDLMLLEVRIERGQGWLLLERTAGQVPVIVLSSSGREEDVVRGFEAGAADYIPKPYRTHELLARVRTRLAVPQLEPVAAAPARPPRKREKPPQPVAQPPADDAPPGAAMLAETQELATLRMGGTDPQRREAPALLLEGDVTLGRRLYAERQRRRLTLVQAENELKIPMSYLQALESDKFTLLPRGAQAADMVRSYANYLGFDGNEVLAEFQQQFNNEPIQPPPALGGTPFRPPTPRWVFQAVAVALALVLSFGAILAFDPTAPTRLVNSVQNLMVAPAPTSLPTSPAPTAAPPVATAAPAPTAAPTAGPTTTPAPTQPSQ